MYAKTHAVCEKLDVELDLRGSWKTFYINMSLLIHINHDIAFHNVKVFVKLSLKTDRHVMTV
jgi:hypothetical protein